MGQKKITKPGKKNEHSIRKEKHEKKDVEFDGEKK